jgi:hypothetical protein
MHLHRNNNCRHLLKSIILAATIITSHIPEVSSEVVRIIDDNSTPIDCPPVILIYAQKSQWTLCLGQMIPINDSCAKVSVKIVNDVFNFIYTGKGWKYSGVHSNRSKKISSLSIDLANDREGHLQRVFIHDLDNILLTHNLHEGRFDLPDATPKFNLSVQRMVYHCPEEQIVTNDRKYTYPPNYRRDPVLNYPELSMFHYGRSVRMPESGSLFEYALYYFFHPTTRKKISFDNPDEIMKREAWLNRHFKRRHTNEKPKKRRRNSLIKFKPLN